MSRCSRNELNILLELKIIIWNVHTDCRTCPVTNQCFYLPTSNTIHLLCCKCSNMSDNIWLCQVALLCAWKSTVSSESECTLHYVHHAVSQWVEALGYNLEGRGFNSRSSCWYLSLTKSFLPHYGSGVESAPNINEYQGYLLGGKGGQCVRLKSLLPSRFICW